MIIDVDVDELMRDKAEESSNRLGTSFITHDFNADIKIFHKKNGKLRFRDVIQPFLVSSRSFEQRQLQLSR